MEKKGSNMCVHYTRRNALPAPSSQSNLPFFYLPGATPETHPKASMDPECALLRSLPCSGGFWY